MINALEMLDWTREAWAQLERDTKACAEDLATQERRLAQARQPLPTAGAAEDRAWVEVWEQNVQHAREDYASMRAVLREMRARDGVSA